MDGSETATAPPLASDIRRNGLALGIAAATTVIVVSLYTAVVRETFTVNLVITTSFVFWIAYSTAYLVCTQLVFRRASPATLSLWLGATRARRFRDRVADDLTGSGPTWTAQWCLLALASVALVSLSPPLLTDPLANGLSFAVVVSSWLVTIEAYALHYARLSASDGGLDFPGQHAGGAVFMDYFYLAAQISTTFSSSDVTVTTTRARRVVTGQTLIAFAYNTFIIAFLIGIVFVG